MWEGVCCGSTKQNHYKCKEPINMKYTMIVDRRAIIRDTYEVDVPQSILAEIMMNNDGELSRMDIADYILSEYEPKDIELLDTYTVDVDLQEDEFEDEVAA
jgi:hypothetical protein